MYWQVSKQFESLEQMMKAFKLRARALSNAVDPDVPDFLMEGGSKKRSKNTRRKRRSVKTK
jgi:hypothetical protein